MDEQPNNDNNSQNQAPENATEARLLELRKRALEALLPLVDKIDEPAERKFEILMTAARSSDDPDLLAKTLEAAQHVGNDSQKAEAILDVLNEINYHLSNS
ncbi:MAG TPA: hypothetical protein VHA37_00215 [Candidatus Saccharimonadales bacterium]|nr:hypothetical protein [Candidatus Saccharimonadales bacterium]